MAYQYSDLVDVAKVTQIVGTNYLNMAKIATSGLLSIEGEITQGTTEDWIRAEMFESDSTGQAIGVNSQISLKTETQTRYKCPVMYRADGALLDDIYEKISVKDAQRQAETRVINGINKKAAQMVDGVYVAIINGWVTYCATNDVNYLNKNGSQVSPAIMQEGKAERLDEGEFSNGILLCRSLLYYKLGALGMAAYTSNTLGAMAQNSLIQTGKVVNDTYLGMTVLMTDKLYNVGGTTTESDSYDHYFLLMERGSIRSKGSTIPEIDPLLRERDSFQTVAKFKIGLGGTIKNVSWQGSVGGDGEITNTALETYTNWTTAVKSGNEKYIPVAVVRVDQPSF